ncbi:MAG: hypothetical protein IKV89_03180 [Clostridia bacterium]|nr:hypothetical protein [Clostridia bacterium]
MSRRRKRKKQPVSRAKKRLALFGVRLCACTFILCCILLCNLATDYTAVLVRKTLGESTDPAYVKEQAVTVFKQFYTE